VKILTTLLLGLITLFYTQQPTILEQILANKELRAVTRYNPTTYYDGPTGKAGLEYDLLKRFTKELDVKLTLVVVDNFEAVLENIIQQEVHLAAAGLAIDDTQRPSIRFGPPYQHISHQLIFRKGVLPLPTKLAEFTPNHVLNIIAAGNQISLVHQLKNQYPQLVWRILPDVEPGEMLEQIWEGEINYAVVDSNEIAQIRRFYPELEVAMELPQRQKLAWAFPQTTDNSLYLAVVKFFHKLRRKGELAQLIERYYGHIDQKEQFDYVNIRVFHRHIVERLPKYREQFEKIAARYHLDWRLLAALGYEESKWDPTAVSMTGVRGLMMLTQSTAKEMGVTNRDDPLQSIEGGTRYLLSLKDKIDSHIPEPDRTWFALAAYNVGLGHLRDAMKITVWQGGNPHRWVDVKKHLPKLSEEIWYKKTPHGQARGYEPVKMVKNVRKFYDILVRYDTKTKKDLPKYYPPNPPYLFDLPPL